MNTIKHLCRTIAYLIALISLAVFTPVIAKADTGSETAREEFFAVSEEDARFVEEAADELFEGASRYRQSYLFIPAGGEAYDYGCSEDIKTETEIVDCRLNIRDTETVIGICRYDPDSSPETEITISYTCGDAGAVPCFRKADGSIIPASAAGKAAVEKMSDGSRRLKIDLDFTKLADAAGYASENGYMAVLSLASADTDIIVSSIGIETGRGIYCAARAMTGECEYMESAAIAGYTRKKDAVIKYTNDGNSLSIASSDGMGSSLSECNTGYTLTFEENSDIKAAAEIISTDDASDRNSDAAIISADTENSDSAATETSEDTDSEADDAADSETSEDADTAVDDTADAETDSIMETDIEERDYSPLSDASMLYSDSYLYASDLVPYTVVKRTGESGVDLYGRVYASGASVGAESMYLEEPEILLGCSAADIMLSGNSMKITVAASADADYAGIMHIVTDEYSDSISGTFGDDAGFEAAGCSTASPSEYGFAISQDDCNAIPLSAAFVKGGGSGYPADSSVIILTEAFLKKASYCAVDADGIVCAIYNEHGRLLSLADGYEEGDVAGFILIPASDSCEEPVIISELTIDYNDELSAGQNYASVEYLDDAADPVLPVFTMSSYIDGGSELAAALLSDQETMQFKYSIISGEIDITADEESGYCVARVGSSETLEAEAELILEAGENEQPSEDDEDASASDDETASGEDADTSSGSDDDTASPEGTDTTSASDGDTASDDDSSSAAGGGTASGPGGVSAPVSHGGNENETEDTDASAGGTASSSGGGSETVSDGADTPAPDSGNTSISDGENTAVTDSGSTSAPDVGDTAGDNSETVSDPPGAPETAAPPGDSGAATTEAGTAASPPAAALTGAATTGAGTAASPPAAALTGACAAAPTDA